MRDNYDDKILSEYENILLKKRGWVSKIPENKTCIFIFSGGLDSVSTIARLIIDFDINTYPLFINRGQTNLEFEQKSVDYFNKLFLERFPKNYNDIKKINSEIPINNLKNDLQDYMKKKRLSIKRYFYGNVSSTIRYFFKKRYKNSIFSKRYRRSISTLRFTSNEKYYRKCM